ncbi:hypothetical protein [Pseudochryseolinea flava]|uniref:Uncharacterized protein n=1 Tax=Pseudochryseolinea flava TaxID=2059302 RepID=A0A364Y3D7_9BACT|nr:hypothetical protein [Pseudochryseolinea flava]RAW01239.1 hypothetical protein DQQ10_10020 [Pseudochryseolinea flava]
MNLNQLKEVDQFKIGKTDIRVYFNDPMIQMARLYPDFDTKTSTEKFGILSDYLHNNPLYVFIATNKKKKLNRLYVLRGNPIKQRTKNYFLIDILDETSSDLFDRTGYENDILKTIDKVNAGGSLFEHMVVFQTPEGKSVVGKGIKFWDYFTRVEPYSEIKSTVQTLIEMDLTNSIPSDYLLTKTEMIKPLFEYQDCAILKVKSREIKTTVYSYDSLGKVKNEYPRIEKDYDLYYSSTSQELTGVTTFPFFSSTDKRQELEGGAKIKIESNQPYLNHYLKDIVVTKNLDSGVIERIEGKLIIHAYSASGHSTFDELYVAEFKEVGDCNLPVEIRFHSLDDVELRKPRIVTQIIYVLK